MWIPVTQKMGCMWDSLLGLVFTSTLGSILWYMFDMESQIVLTFRILFNLWISTEKSWEWVLKMSTENKFWSHEASHENHGKSSGYLDESLSCLLSSFLLKKSTSTFSLQLFPAFFPSQLKRSGSLTFIFHFLSWLIELGLRNKHNDLFSACVDLSQHRFPGWGRGDEETNVFNSVIH